MTVPLSVFIKKQNFIYSFLCFPGLRSYGKVVYLLTPMTIVGYIVFTSKILAGFQLSEFQAYIQDTNWWDFIYNTKVS